MIATRWPGAIPDAIKPLATSTTSSRSSIAVTSSQTAEAGSVRRASIGRVGSRSAVSKTLSARPPVRGE
ncbi:hypothetical protein SPURM210S_01943 [Streptomyces purpurascens]